LLHYYRYLHKLQNYNPEQINYQITKK